jgi:hypothetical protein
MSSPANSSAIAPVLVPLANIPTEASAQPRVHIRASVVRAYAAAMKHQLADGGLRFPPVLLFTDGRQH